MEFHKGSTGRFFFGFSIQAPWAQKEPQGRAVPIPFRHMTTDFLGNRDRKEIELLIPQISFPSFFLTGILKELIFLPFDSPRTVSTTCQFFTGEKNLYEFVKKEFLPHTTLCRSPFDKKGWVTSFKPLPFFSQQFALFETVGSLQYEIKHSWPLLIPFSPIDHPAGLCFKIQAFSYEELYYHAAIALSFSFPTAVSFIQLATPQDFDSVLDELNKLIARLDSEHGSPFKSVSVHGEAFFNGPILTWEMIVQG